MLVLVGVDPLGQVGERAGVDQVAETEVEVVEDVEFAGAALHVEDLLAGELVVRCGGHVEIAARAAFQAGASTSRNDVTCGWLTSSLSVTPSNLPDTGAFPAKAWVASEEPQAASTGPRTAAPPARPINCSARRREKAEVVTTSEPIKPLPIGAREIRGDPYW